MNETSSMGAGYAEVNGARLYYEVTGEGEALVLVHAGIADHRMWNAQFGEFAQHYRTVRFDMRGFGQSAMVQGPFSSRDDLRGLLDHLGIERAHLMGCSMGGETVFDFALEHPERAGAVVLVASAPIGYEFTGDPPAQWPAIVAANKAGDLATVAELETQLWFDGRGRTAEQMNPDLRQLVIEMNSIALRSEPLREEHESRLDPAAIKRLADFHHPLLYIYGDRDDANFGRVADFLKQELGAAVTMIPDTAHLPNMEQPQQFNRIVLDFLAGL